MKLSKARQEVVDKMREEWDIRHNTATNSYYMINVNKRKHEVTTYEMFQTLFENGIIEFDYSEKRSLVYRLTEPFKTEQK